MEERARGNVSQLDVRNVTLLRLFTRKMKELLTVDVWSGYHENCAWMHKVELGFKFDEEESDRSSFLFLRTNEFFHAIRISKYFVAFPTRSIHLSRDKVRAPGCRWDVARFGSIRKEKKPPDAGTNGSR